MTNEKGLGKAQATSKIAEFLANVKWHWVILFLIVNIAVILGKYLGFWGFAIDLYLLYMMYKSPY